MQVLAIAQSKVNASIHKFVTCFYGRLPYVSPSAYPIPQATCGCSSFPKLTSRKCVPHLIAKNPLGSRLSSHGLHCRGSRSPKSRRPNWAWKLWRPHWPWCFCAPVPPDGAHQAQHPRYAGSLHRTWNQNCEGMKPHIWVPLQAMLSCGDDLKQAAKHSQNSTEWRTPQLPAMGKLDQEDQLRRLHACVFCRHTCWEIKDIKAYKGIFMNNIWRST